jgi:molecular chaperone GrpE
MSNDKSAHDDKHNHISKEEAEQNIKSCDFSREEDCHPASDKLENDLESNLEAEATANESPVTQLEQKIAELKDMYVRSQAEIQNIQRRHQEEQKKTREYAISSFAKDLVAVKDYLEMALKDESGNFEMLKMGVDLTLKQLVQVFDGQKIKEVTPKTGDKLDPHQHQAMNTVEVEGQEPNTIVTVMQKGYLLHDRVLRPAMVTVAK